ncbi:MAG: cache domain-containing protein [Burkholderiaceae bacterium]|nr:cache domain-containing protein [Burkholderiaceae bacterium]
MALAPLLVVLPLLAAVLLVWGNAAYDRLLITKVRSDLAVARGYFDQVLAEVGSGTSAVAESHALLKALQGGDAATVNRLLLAARERLGLDYLTVTTSAADDAARTAHAMAEPAGERAAQLAVLDEAQLTRLAPHLLARLQVPIVPTLNAAPSDRKVENRAMVMRASAAVTDDSGRTIAMLHGGVLLNHNLPFIDHINRIVYPDGSLPLDSQGTATLFMDDVRITTNVRLFKDQRAVGTRVSRAVSDAVLKRGDTWLDRAFVVSDWYVSAYEPLLDATGRRVGMLYVGFLEKPFRAVKYGMLGVIGAIFLGVMALAAWFSLRWARSIFRPVEQMNQTMQRIEDGDGAARVGPVAAQDELGALANHLDQLLDVIGEKTRALERWAVELDGKVAERTAELARSNASLVQAQQQLVKSEKLAAIGQLTASVAHEINNPIAVIQGNLDLMRETLGDQAAPVSTELKLVDEQVERMRLIVTQLLQYARPTEFAGYVETLDVNRVLEDSLVLVGHLLAHTRIEVTRDLQARNRAGVNRQELQQVIINLLVNAIQAMPEGGTLSLQTRDWQSGDGAPGVALAVADTGAGLAPQTLERLFRPFFTTRNDGNGLGLWISRGLVERYGGTLTAGNRSDGRGAIFEVHLTTEPQAPVESSASTNNGRPIPDR